MSYAAYKTFEIEEIENLNQSGIKMSKPFALPGNRQILADRVTRSVVAVVNFELEQGSMPA